MRFETEQDLNREEKAIQTFVDRFNGSFQKLGRNDVDYRVFDENKNLVAYAEIKGLYKSIANAYPLPVAMRKVSKLCDKRLNPVLIWACDDGIIYGKVYNLEGSIKWGGRPPRDGAMNDAEMMVYFDKQKEFRYIRCY